VAVGSITKTITAPDVMVLAERGLVDLDAQVTDYVDLPFDAAGLTGNLDTAPIGKPVHRRASQWAVATLVRP